MIVNVNSERVTDPKRRRADFGDTTYEMEGNATYEMDERFPQEPGGVKPSGSF